MKAAISSIFSPDLVERLKKPAYSTTVLGVLMAIGVWGHETEWTFSPSHSGVIALSRSAAAPPSASDATAASDGATPIKGPGEPAAIVAERDAIPSRIEFPTPESVRAIGIEMAAPQCRSVTREVTATAVITYEPSRQAQLSARVAGTLWRLEKNVGETIHSGDVLAIIDAPAVGQAKADFLHAMADVELRKKAHDRLNSFARGEVATKQVEEAFTELRKARVDLFNAQQALISLGFAIKLDQWQGLSESELQGKIKFLGLPDAAIKDLDPDSTTATLLPIFAPFDGLVIGHNMAKGEVVSPMASHFQIADVSRMWIVLHVREQDADDLALGQKITFSAGKVTVTGSLSWVSTEVDEKTRTVEVRSVVENPELAAAGGQTAGRRLLRANLFGVGTIHIQENPSALVVPAKAIQRAGQTHVVFVSVDAQTFEVRTVQLGIMTGELAEVIDGIDPTARVVVEGSHVLKAELQRFATAGPP